jgi:hypothetical protein
MSEIEITDDDIEAVTDPAVCRLADTIVLRNQGCGNASVLIDRFVKQVRHEARAEALEERLNALPDEIDLFRIIRRAGRKDADKARAVHRALRSGEREG